MSVEILVGDAVERLRGLPSNSVHCVVTSPPYWGLRDYVTGEWDGGDPACDHLAPLGGGFNASGLANYDNGLNAESVAKKIKDRGKQFRDICGKCGARRIDQQIGLEPSPELWAARLVEVFREVRRVLRPDGCLWLNVGDSYAQRGFSGGFNSLTKSQSATRANGFRSAPPGYKGKDLVGQPWLLAFALRADGWYLRSEIIWAKPNPMPESVTDRCTKSHEQVFLLAKSGETTFWLHRDLPGTRTRPAPDYRWVHKETGEEVSDDPCDPENWKRINLWSGRDYFYDQEAAREVAEYGVNRATYLGGTSRINEANMRGGGHVPSDIGMDRPQVTGRNLRSVWTIATEAWTEAHFATFPTELARRCILAGTSAKGCCPKCAAPWARVVEREKAPAVDPSELDRYGNGSHGVHRKIGSQYQNWLDANPPQTTGWSPTCACDAGEPVPAVVLDPFGGSGTTGLVAEQLGRNAILIELNPTYAEMSRRRIDGARARRAIGRVDERPATLPGQLEFSL